MIPQWLNSDGDDDRERWPVSQPIHPPDDWLADRLSEALRRDPFVSGRRLEVLVQNQVAILLGELDSAEAREAARRRAWSIPGIQDVCNRLTVAGSDELW